MDSPRDLHIDIILCWPEGCGGHFINSCILDYSNRLHYKNNLNEYTSFDKFYNLLDFMSYKSSVYEPMFDSILYQQTILFNDLLASSHMENLQILKCHNLPYYLNKSFKLVTDEFISIIPKSDILWFVYALSKIKQLCFTPSWQDYNISDIVNFSTQFNRNIHINSTEYKLFFNQIRNDIRLAYFNKLYESYIIWEYMIYSKANDKEITVDMFLKYLTDRIFIIPDHYMRQVDSYDIVDDFKNISKVFTKIDYTDFFIKQILPESGTLVKISKAEIRGYTMKNIEVLAHVIQLLEQDQKEIYIKKLEDIALKVMTSC